VVPLRDWKRLPSWTEKASAVVTPLHSDVFSRRDCMAGPSHQRHGPRAVELTLEKRNATRGLMSVVDADAGVLLGPCVGEREGCLRINYVDKLCWFSPCLRINYVDMLCWFSPYYQDVGSLTRDFGLICQWE
jgi:hypothetical protein